jgi:hypothetical protein
MTFGQIKCFITVVNEQSFAKAANALFVSQPAVSKSISNMEQEFGFPLMERKYGELRLTPAGAKLYDFFVKMDQSYQEVIDEIRQSMQASAETILIGCPDTWDPAKFYDKIMDHFKENFPSIRLEIEGSRLPDLLGRLQSGALDLIMTYELYRPVQYGFSVQRLTDTGCGILYSKSHYKNVKTLADLNGADFLIFDVDVEKKFGKVVKKICSDWGFTPQIKNFNRFGTALFNMTCGNGVLLYTEWDNIFTNTPYGIVPLPNRVPVNLVYPNMSDKPGIQLVAGELVKLFA